MSSTTRSISQLAARLLKFRFVEPTLESQPSATTVLAWIMGPPYSKILTPASRNCLYPAREALPIQAMSSVAGVRTLTSTPSRAVAISDWVRIGMERK